MGGRMGGQRLTCQRRLKADLPTAMKPARLDEALGGRGLIRFLQPEGLLDWPLNPHVLKRESPHTPQPLIFQSGFHFKEQLRKAHCIRAVKIYPDVLFSP